MTVAMLIRRVIWGLLLSCLLIVSGCGEDAPRRYNVLLVTLDTTRADHIGAYGSNAASTPVLDRLAKEGVLFAQAESAAPITAPSHSTILTGLYPIGHGFRDNGLFVLDEGQTTLAEILRDAGYDTAAAIGAYPLLSRFGFSQGFDLYDDKITAPLENHLGGAPHKQRLFFDERRAAQVNDAILPWLKARGGNPFFLWLHYFDPHQPFEPPPPYDQLFSDNPYAGEIAYADSNVGFVLDQLKKMGELENTLVVVVADHGEGLGQHSEETHAMLAYESTLRVPLIIRLPEEEKGRGRVVEQRVGSVDIAPTIVDILGIKGDYDFQGRSLAPLWRSQHVDGETVRYYAENLSPRLTHGWGELRVIYENSLKYIHGPVPEMFDLSEDPDELHNLIPDEPDTARRLRGELTYFLEQYAADEVAVPTVDEDVLQRLRSLGYLHTAGENPAIVERLVDTGLPPQQGVSDLNAMSAAKQLLFKGDFSKALGLTQKLVGSDPYSPVYRELHATALLGTGHLDSAWQMGEALLADGNLSSLLARELAQAYVAAGHIAASAVFLETFLEEKGADSLTQWRLARIYRELGRREEAISLLVDVVEGRPELLEARTDLATEYARVGRKNEAISEFVEITRSSPYYTRGFYNYGVLLYASGDLVAAKTALSRALAIEPGNQRVQNALKEVLAEELRVGSRDNPERKPDSGAAEL